MSLRRLPALCVAISGSERAGGGASVAHTDADIGELIRRTADANSALVRGDFDRYLALIEHADDYTLMAPFGGAPRRGIDTSSEGRAATARFFKSGTFDQEVVATYDSGDLVILVTIE